MTRFPLQQPPSSGGHATQAPPRRLRPNPGLLLSAYGAAYLLLQVAANALSPHDALWYYPAALSVALLLVFGLRYLPAVILAPLPLDLLFRPLGLPPLVLVGIAVSFGLAHALAVLAFRRAGFSPRLRRPRDVGGFILLAFLGPLLAILPVALLLKGPGHIVGPALGTALRTVLPSDILGVMALSPALLLWAWPGLRLGWTRLRRGRPAFQPAEFLLQCLGVVLAMLVVARFSEPGTLHLKYLLFVPIFWMVVRGGTRVASLGFLVLNLAMALVVLEQQVTVDAVLGAQAFLLVLFSVSLYLGAAVDAHATILVGHERSSRRLNQLLEGTGAIPWEMDLVTGRCGYLGLGAGSLLGHASELWHKQPYWGEVIHPDDQLSFLRFLKDMGRPEQDHQLEFRLRGAGGGEHRDEHWVRAVGGLEPGAADRAMGFLFDIHAHKRAEENALRASLKEKDLLLREIHHRVKNNLQVVSSLLRLQASTHEDPALQRALHEAQERIQAIALIHQKLKHAPDYSQLDLPGYVRTLAERLVRSYASVPALIDLQVRVAEVDIGPDAPVPLGLILNELVANALQHAFPPGTGGSLDIEIAPDGDGWILVRVADSGVGLPEAVELDHGGLGFQLVQALTDQLGGALELERRRGASFLLRFPPTHRQP